MTVDYLLWPQPVLFVMDMIHPLLHLNKIYEKPFAQSFWNKKLDTFSINT